MPSSILPTYQRAKNILVDCCTATQPLTIYKVGQDWDMPVGTYYGLLKTLTAVCRVRSLQPAGVPEMPELPSPSQKYTIARDATWATPRFHLQVVARHGGDWQVLTTASIQNHDGVEHYTLPLLKYISGGVALACDSDFEVAIKVIDAGYGIPNPNLDSIVVFGEAHEEAQARAIAIQSCEQVAWPVGPESSLLTAGGPMRLRLTLVNAGTTKVYLARAGEATAGRGLLLLPGGTLDLDASYTGPVAAVSPDGPGLLTGEECW